MENQNITLSVPRDLLKRAKRIALERDTSVSGLIRELLVELVTEAEDYDESMREYLDFLREPKPLAASWQWNRTELYEGRG